MDVGRTNQRHQYNINGREICETTAEKDLGVLVNHNLKFDAHIHKIVSKANSILGLIRRTCRNWTEKGFATVYRTYVRPHLESAVSMCSPQLGTTLGWRTILSIDKIENVQW